MLKNKNRGYQQLRVWRDGDWVDSLFVKESNEVYENSRTTKM